MSEPRKGYRTCSKCGRNRADRFFRGARGHVCQTCRTKRARSNTRATRVAETYCISLTEYDAILAAQGGVCAICKAKRNYNLDIDHDHAVERALLAAGVEPCQAKRRSIRGLLCKTCNRRLLRAARDSVTILGNAIDYLHDTQGGNALLTDHR